MLAIGGCWGDASIREKTMTQELPGTLGLIKKNIALGRATLMQTNRITLCRHGCNIPLTIQFTILEHLF